MYSTDTEKLAWWVKQAQYVCCRQSREEERRRQFDEDDDALNDEFRSAILTLTAAKLNKYKCERGKVFSVRFAHNE